MIKKNLNKIDVEDILSSYSIGFYKSHVPLKYIGNNNIYIVETSRGKYILKIYKNYDLDYRRFVLSVQDFVSKNDCPTPRVEHTEKGDLFLVFKDKIIAIQEYIEGKHPKRYSKSLLVNMASTFSRLNKTLLQYPLKKRNPWKWYDDYQFEPKLIIDVFGFNIGNENKLFDEMNKLSKFKLRKSVIHADLTPVNILVNKNCVSGIIDWDSCRQDYITQDIATVLTCICENNRKVDGNKIALYINEYEKNFKLNHEERKSIYYFMKIKMLAHINYAHKLTKKQPENAQSIKEWAYEILKNYRALDKLTLEEFIHLI